MKQDNNDNSAVKSSIARSLLKIQSLQKRQRQQEFNEQNLVYLASKKSVRPQARAEQETVILKPQVLIVEDNQETHAPSAHKQSIARAKALLTKTTQSPTERTHSDLASAALKLKSAPGPSPAPIEQDAPESTCTKDAATQELAPNASLRPESNDAALEHESAVASQDKTVEASSLPNVASLEAQLDEGSTICNEPLNPKSMADDKAMDTAQSTDSASKGRHGAKLKITAGNKQVLVAPKSSTDNQGTYALLNTGGMTKLGFEENLQVTNHNAQAIEISPSAPQALAINGKAYDPISQGPANLWVCSPKQDQCEDLESFYTRYGKSTAQIQESTRSKVDHVIAQEDIYLGQRYGYALSKVKTVLLEQTLFGSNLSETVNKQLSFLELLLVLLSQSRFSLNSAHSRTNTELKPTYFVNRQAEVLRRIVFNNPMVERIASSNRSDHEKWSAWQAEFIDFNNKGRQSFKLERGHVDLLTKVFTNFHNFAKAVTVLNSWSIVPPKAKLWSERYLFPFGAETLLGAFDKAKQGSCYGQLLFTLLYRASSHKALLLLKERFLERHDSFNVFAQILSNSFGLDEDNLIAKMRSDKITLSEQELLYEQGTLSATDYVPYLSVRICNQLEQDFRQLLELNLTKAQLYQSLCTIGMLNLMVYFQEQEQRLSLINDVSAEQLQALNAGEPLLRESCSTDIVVCMGNKPSASITKLSQGRLLANSKLHKKSLRNFIANRITLLVRCVAPFLLKEEGLNPQEQEVLCNLVRALFAFDPKQSLILDVSSKGSIELKERTSLNSIHKNYTAEHNSFNLLRNKAPYPNYQSMLNMLTDAILSLPSELEESHRNLAKQAGLLCGTTKASQHYAFTDELLYSLVLTCVDKDKSMIMLSEFLEKLYKRYHLIIGPQQAHHYFVAHAHGRSIHIEEKEFENNLQELIAQLKRMDLLINLSDSCEYVINPFALRS